MPMPDGFKGDASSRPPQDRGRSSHADLRDMVSHRHVVEALDILARGPATITAMRTQVRAERRGMESALRALAAGGLVTRSGGGTWDSALSRDRLYWLTGRGRRVVQELSCWSVWTAILDTEADVLSNGPD